MKKKKISPKSAGEATISYSNFKIVECGRGTPPPTPTSSRALHPQFRRYALLVPPFHQQSLLHFFPLANALTQLGLRSHPTGSSTLEALTTLSFIRSDKPVFNTPAFRPCSPCYPTQAVAEPIVSHIRNPYLTFPGGVHHFHRRLDPGLGRSHGGFSDCGCMDHINVLELRAVILDLNYWAIV